MPYPYITKILTTYDNKSRSPQTDLRHHTIEFSRFARAQLSLFYFGFASINNEIIYSRPFGPRINNYWCLKSVCGDLDLLSVGRNNYYVSFTLAWIATIAAGKQLLAARSHFSASGDDVA